MLPHLLVGVCFLGFVAADGWDDFTNNLATDLAPLLALFGEQVTKQFLSESTTIWDNVVFAMAPLGIITALVSVIRVCGGPSLRAFIGRAQEGGGVAEAELCSSTSRDVCELFHNGAIVRVFGRPKILEIFHQPDADDGVTASDDGKIPKCSIYSFQEYTKTTSFTTSNWREDGRRPVEDPETQSVTSEQKDQDDGFAPNPNLSLNIGIKRTPKHTLFLASVFLFMAQLSVLIFGGLVTSWGWERDGQKPAAWGLPFMSVGTILLCGGMFSCALLIERSTIERTFRRPSVGKASGLGDSQASVMYVIQPGAQVVGDQTFDPFAFSSSKEGSHSSERYTTSWKEPRQPRDEWRVWCVAAITLFGFVLQFIGSRAIHSAVALLQLGVTVLASVVRAGLRTQRLNEEDNLLLNSRDEIEGHELDWLALHMQKEAKRLVNTKAEEHPSWTFCGHRMVRSFPSTASFNTGAEMASVEIHVASNSNASEDEEIESPQDRHQATPIASADTALKIFYYRSRLAQMTGQESLLGSKSSREWSDSMVSARRHARQLKYAIESSSRVLFRNKLPKAESGSEPLRWDILVNCSTSLSTCHPETLLVPITQSQSGRDFEGVKCKIEYLESIIGLWTWSMTSKRKTVGATDEDITPRAKVLPTSASRLMALAETPYDVEIAKLELGVWCNSSLVMESAILNSPETLLASGPNAVWEWTANGKERILVDIPANSDTWARNSATRTRVFGQQYPSNCPKMALLYPISDRSVYNACTHDVYQSFLFAAIGNVGSIGGHTEFAREGTSFRLVNTVVEDLVECFEHSGLGSSQEAVSIIIPVLRDLGKLPSPTDSWSEFLNDRETMKTRDEYQRREAALRWAWAVANTPEREREASTCAAIMLEIGGLYRKAMFASESILSQFAYKGIDWMEENRNILPETIEDIVARYAHLAQRRQNCTKLPASPASDIISALRKGDRKETLWLLSTQKGEIASLDTEGRSIISLAAERGWSEIVNVILDMRAPMDSPDESKRTPLSYAAENGHIEVVKTLLKHGARPMLENSDGRTPVSFAAAKGQVQTVNLLLDDERVSTSQADSEGLTLLHWAALEGRTGVMARLFQEHVEIDVRDKRGRTPLIVALVNDQKCAADELAAEGARTDIMIEGLKAWRWAVSIGAWACSSFCLNNVPNNDSGSSGGYRRVPDGLQHKKVLIILASKTSSSDTNIRLLASRQTDAVTAYIEDQFGVRAEFDTADVADFCTDEVYGHTIWLCDTSDTDKAPEKVLLSHNEIFKILDQLLDQANTAFKVTDNIVGTIASHSEMGLRLMQLLIRRRGGEVIVTSTVVEAAATNRRCGEQVMMLLMGSRATICVTMDLVNSITVHFTGKVMQTLVDIQGQDFDVTEAVIQAAASNDRYGMEVMRTLLGVPGQKVKITEAIAVAVASNKNSGQSLMRFLLDEKGLDVPITEIVIKAAASNGFSGAEVMWILLDRRGEQVEITDDVVKAAASNTHSGQRLLRLLRSERGLEGTITDAMIEAAASDQSLNVE